jgi:hypothetical protein
MARRRSDAPTRSEITEKVEKHETDMEEKTGEIEETVSDVETERDTLESLDLDGTAETAEEVEQAIEGAQDVSAEEFDTESGELEETHNETEEHEEELQERSDTTSSDLGKISDASAKIHSDSANGELIVAKESAMRDIEFLDDEAKQSEDAREQSQRLHEEHERRVSAARGS